jgi:hypothetical protein
MGLFSLLSSQLTQHNHFSSNMFPPIKTHSRPTSGNMPDVTASETMEAHSASKQQQFRRQQQQHQRIEKQRRSPLRRKSLFLTAHDDVCERIHASCLVVGLVLFEYIIDFLSV